MESREASSFPQPPELTCLVAVVARQIDCMKTDSRYLIALVTAPDLKTARRLARVALENRLAACANLVPAIESHYWWQGKMESSSEVLILFKTRHSHRRSLERLILSQHPYDTAEFLAVSIASGARRYLDWIRDSTVQVSKRRHGRTAPGS